ncbi:MAG: adenosylcobinamide-GDP ribazoletransferase [Verrucomicrobiota bacterium]
MIQRQWSAFCSALTLLTRIPVNGLFHYRPQDASNSWIYFPFVGAFIGILSASILFPALPHFPSSLKILIVMLTSILLTGALHEDGLGDTVDGLFGGTTPEKRLEIMKDSRIGSYAAISLWFLLFAKFYLLQSLLLIDPVLTITSLVIAHCVSRSCTTLLMALLPYVSHSGTKSMDYIQNGSLFKSLIAITIAINITAVLLPTSFIPILMTSLLITLLTGLLYRQKIGGITGDTLGATQQLVELALYGAILFSNFSI